jgi:hypothetical protein
MLAIEPPLPFPRTKCSIGAAATDEQPEAEPDQIGGSVRVLLDLSYRSA